jgi:hypothetical protein
VIILTWSTAARGFRHHWLVVSLIALVIAGATIVAALAVPERYEATSVVAVQPTSTEVSTQLLAYLIPGVEAQTVGADLESEVRKRLPDDTAAKWSVSTSVEPGAGVMNVTVTSEDSNVPVPVANEYASLLSTSDLGTDALSIDVIDLASSSKRASERAVLLVAGIGLTVLVPLLLCFAFGARDERRARTDA